MVNVKDFVNGFVEKKIMNSKINDHAVSDYINKELEIRTYVPFTEKRELCKAVIDACNIKDDNGLIKVDSVSRYIIFTISIISKYTNLEFSSGEDEEYDSLDEYDMLCENHLLNPILALIGEEYEVCNNMLNMMMDDIIANNNTVEAVFGRALSKVSDSIDGLINTFTKKVEEMNFDLSQIDIDKYKGILDLIPKK